VGLLFALAASHYFGGSPLKPFVTIADHSSRIGGFAEHHGRTTLTLRGHPTNATESERKTFEAGFKSMPQGFTRTLEHADCLAKA
jgi:hypothetical protein